MPVFGVDSSETFQRIFKNIGTVDYVGDPTTHANVGVNRFQIVALDVKVRKIWRVK